MSRRTLARALVCVLLVAGLAVVWLPAAAQSGDTGPLVTTELGTVGITSPVTGATVSGDVLITGTATATEFLYYKVEYSVDGSNWVTVDTKYDHTPAISEGDLAEWVTTSLPDGNYWLRAVVVNKTGNFLASDPIEVIVANAGAVAATTEATAEAEATAAIDEVEATAAATVEAPSPAEMTIEDLAGMDAESLRAFLGQTLPGLIPESLTAVEQQLLLDYAVAALSTLASDEHGTVGIFSPVAGEMISGSVDVIGTASAGTLGFGYYKVEYSVDGSNWVTVDATYENKVQVVFDTLDTWDTTAVADGMYWLRAVVVDGTGNFVASNPVQVAVANVAAPVAAEEATAVATEEAPAAVEEATAVATEEAAAATEAPAAEEVAPVPLPMPLGVVGIASPVAGASLSGVVDITGTATADNFNYYKVEYSVDGSNWVTVDATYENKVQVTDGVLDTWDTTTVPDGSYWLKATIVDNTGNYGLATEPIMVTVANAS